LAIVVRLPFEGLLAVRNVEPGNGRAVRRHQLEIVAADLDGSVHVKSGANHVVFYAENSRRELGRGEQDLGGALKVLATDDQLDISSALAAAGKHPLNIGAHGRDSRGAKHRPGEGQE